jgi:chromatin segregation and condensation protein Rec8/ScpA/Scc1 (kleisin family)
MQGELNILENKLAQLVSLTKRMRAENHQLRQDLAEALSRARQSDDKITNAKSRLENILAKLPDEKL